MANFDQKSLKALKKQLKEKNKAQQAEKQEQRKQEIQEQQDENFFKEAMSGVNPLNTNNNVHSSMHEKQKPSARVLDHSQFEEAFEINDPLSDEREITEIDGGEVLSFCRTGIQRNVFKKLRSGAYRISDELDLHGYTVKQAKEVLIYYLQEAVQFEGCCIRVIHGKGLSSGKQRSVLKTYINHWLSEHERVLAFHSAKIKDGGTGAVYVLLKTQN